MGFAQVACLVLALNSVSLSLDQPSEITVASGTLAHHALTNDLFHIGHLWMRVKPDTEFHRWLSQGIHHEVSIVLTTDPARFADEPDVRILSGKLVHGLAPDETPMVHILSLSDDLAGSVGPVTLETTDLVIASRFDGFEGAHVSIVFQLSRATP